MNLIIFDIDGTLTQTNKLDSDCFVQAIEDILQIKGINSDWAGYRYSTDSGLIKEIFESLFSREPSHHEINLIQERFVSYLNSAYNANHQLITPVQGADKIFHAIDTTSKWHIGIATGGWKKSALFKLDSANIPHITIPKAYADDHIERTEIIKTTIKHAQSINQINQYEKIIYVGDRDWDERAAMELGIGFIGVGQAIRQKSRHFCIESYDNSAAFLEHLNSHHQ